MALESTATDTVSILYVEDDRETRTILLSMLEKKYPEEQFFSAGNGVQGLRLFSELHPAIVITDISMPKLDGLSMASQIKMLCPETIIIAVTAHSETNNLIQAIELGINHYVLKPVSYERLFSSLDHSINTVKKEQLLRNNVDHIKQLNTDLLAKTRQLEGVISDLETFNYAVAHDLRTPLVSISGFSQYLLAGHSEDLDNAGKELIQVIFKEAVRMNGLIGTLLKLSSYSHKKLAKKWVDLSSIAHDIEHNLFRREPRRAVTINVADNVKGYCDPALISVVIENLLENAWKYSTHTQETHIEFGAMNKDEELVYYVRDNGAGFEKHEAASLFAPFHRLQCDGDIDGFGIGLATAYRIIQLHGGRIWADGEKDNGATFSFTL